MFWKITRKVFLFELQLILLQHKESDPLRIFYPNKSLQLSLWKWGDIQSWYMANAHLSVFIWMSIIHIIPMRGDLAWGRKMLSLSEDNFFHGEWKISYPCLRFPICGTSGITAGFNGMLYFFLLLMECKNGKEQIRQKESGTKM